MPTPLELAIMAQGAYKLKDEEKFQLPYGWYVVHKYFPRTSWDVGIVIYERIISIDEDNEGCRQRESSDIPGENGKVAAFIRVERVFAFRGTVSLWNWVTNLGLLF